MSSPASSRIRSLAICSGVIASITLGCIVVSRAAAHLAHQSAGQAATTQPATAPLSQTQARHIELERAEAAKAGAQSTTYLSLKASDSPTHIVSVNFPGGTVQEYVQLLRTSAKDPVNIAASEQLLSTQIPEIELKNVTLMSALRALGTIGDGAGMIDVRDLSLVGKTGERVGSPVYEVIWVPRRASEEHAVTTYSLFDRLPALTDDDATRMAETLVSAAQAALQMSGSSATWDLKFHRPSRLLLVKGSRNQIEVVSGVVERMTENWARDAYHKSASGADTEARTRLERAKAELAKETEEVRARLEEMMQTQERRAEAAKKEGLTEPGISQVEQMRLMAMRDAYNARQMRMQRLDDQLLNLRTGQDHTPNIEVRLNALEMRLSEISTMLEKRFGSNK